MVLTCDNVRMEFGENLGSFKSKNYRHFKN